MSNIAEKLSNKLIQFLDMKTKNNLEKTVLAIGVRAAIKYLHFQSMKGIYEIRNPDKSEIK